MKLLIPVIVSVLLTRPGIASADDVAEADMLHLTLPPHIYAVPGLESSVYFDNVVLTQTPDAYRFEVDCAIGTSEDRRWTVVPKPSHIGQVPFSLRVLSRDGQLLQTAESLLQVVPRTAGHNREIRILIVGDSLTHATIYPNELVRLLSQPDNPRWNLLGTHRPNGAATGVAHEGSGGWTWARFAFHHEPNPDGTYRKRSSPFVFVTDNGQPGLDVARYVREHCDGQPPDFVVFLLGINDCFGAPPDDPSGIDVHIDKVFAHADTLLHEFRRAAPDAELGICLTPPPNSREEAFHANYKGRYHRWGWKRIQHRLVQRQLEHFANHPQQAVSVVPVQLNIDSIDGYPANNGVHPNESGYRQIASGIYCWLKSRL